MQQAGLSIPVASRDAHALHHIVMTDGQQQQELGLQCVCIYIWQQGNIGYSFDGSNDGDNCYLSHQAVAE